MQIEEHRTGFDQTLTLEQSTAEQIGEEACLFFFPQPSATVADKGALLRR